MSHEVGEKIGTPRNGELGFLDSRKRRACLIFHLMSRRRKLRIILHRLLSSPTLSMDQYRVQRAERVQSGITDVIADCSQKMAFPTAAKLLRCTAWLGIGSKLDFR